MKFEEDFDRTGLDVVCRSGNTYDEPPEGWLNCVETVTCLAADLPPPNENITETLGDKADFWNRKQCGPLSKSRNVLGQLELRAE